MGVEINYMLMEKEGLEGRAARQAYLKKCYDFQCICSACNLEGDQFEADEGLRESLRQMKDRGIELLTDNEVAIFVAGLYTIQAKLSYIFEVVEQVFLGKRQSIVCMDTPYSAFSTERSPHRFNFGTHEQGIPKHVCGICLPKTLKWTRIILCLPYTS